MEQALTETPHVKYPLIDGHSHIDQFESQVIDQIIERATEVNVGLIISAGTTMESCRRVIQLAENYPIIRGGIGLHPADLIDWISDKEIAELKQLASHPTILEWSETGLDYMPGSPPHDLQKDAFRKQIRMAKEFGLPLVIHSREADEDSLKILIEEKVDEIGGAWHYFQGNLYLAEKIIKLGFKLSLAKPLLRDLDLQKTVEQLPLSEIVIETDSYPQLFKKNPIRRTEPWHLPQVAEKIADLHRIDIDVVAKETTQNYLAMLKNRIQLQD
ncbi:MAG: hypothetical protein CL777_04590 [Chloroflexi bacterium]|nr:hypothetical protein [Chloroflexota bacterium]|tara:strand:+ start:3338 stop:4153 length:816 start_codon:yes stop_codon:yes gene_type:complete